MSNGQMMYIKFGTQKNFATIETVITRHYHYCCAAVGSTSSFEGNDHKYQSGNIILCAPYKPCALGAHWGIPLFIGWEQNFARRDVSNMIGAFAFKNQLLYHFNRIISFDRSHTMIGSLEILCIGHREYGEMLIE